jgi:methionyl-tRNA synthetase
MALAREGNRYFDSSEPWRTARSDREKCALSIRTGLQFMDWLRSAFHPFLPFTSEAIGKTLGTGAPSLDSMGACTLAEGAAIGRPAILFRKLDEGFESALETVPPAQPPTPAREAGEEQPVAKPLVSIEDFRKLDLRAGRIVTAEPVPGADKLVKLGVDVGEAEPRQVVAGIRPWYPIETLPGRGVIVVCNLEPVKLRGVESRGMILASDGGSGIFLVEPSSSAGPGDRVR